MTRLTFSKKLFVRRKDMDFRDDGTAFRIYFYKGVLPISVATWNGTKFVCIRLDYLGIHYNEYKEDLKVLDEFNGIDNVDMKKFVSNCEYIVAKYNL